MIKKRNEGANTRFLFGFPKIPGLLAAMGAPWKYQDPQAMEFSTAVGSLAKQNSLKHNGGERLQNVNGPNYSTAAFK